MRYELADYGWTAIRPMLPKKGAWTNIPPKSNRSDPIYFSPYLYRARNPGRAVLQQDQTMSSGGDAL